MKWLSLLLAGLISTAVPAEITGTWKAAIENASGRFENTFVFEIDGTTLTGTVKSGTMGALPISEGKVDGNDVAFVVVQKSQDHDFRMVYNGRLDGDELKLTLTFPLGKQTVSMTARRVTE